MEESKNLDPYAADDYSGIYSVCLYWSVFTLTSIGYGDVTANNPIEFWVCSLCMLGSGVIWAYLIGNACSMLATTDVHTLRFRQQMDEINYMMEERKMPTDLKR